MHSGRPLIRSSDATYNGAPYPSAANRWANSVSRESAADG